MNRLGSQLAHFVAAILPVVCLAWCSTPVLSAQIGIDDRNLCDETGTLASSQGFDEFRRVMEGIGHVLKPLTSFGDEELEELDALILLQPNAADGSAGLFSKSEIGAINAFTHRGGGLLVHAIADAEADSSVHNLNALLRPYGATFGSAISPSGQTLIPHEVFGANHVVIDGIRRPLRLTNIRPFELIQSPATDLLKDDADAPQFVAVIDRYESNGNVVVLSNIGLWRDLDGDGETANRLFLENIVRYITTPGPMIVHPVGILMALLAVLAVIFWFGDQPVGKKIFGIIPKLVFCYFVPTTLTTMGILPAESELYTWIKSYMLPASLLLMILALDVPGILRLGPRAVIMLLAGTAGVVIGGPLALLICKSILPSAVDAPDSVWALPADTWQGMTALCGSWIGGGANMVALKEISGCTQDMFVLMVIVDVFVANIWMGVLLYASGQQKRIDRWTGADASAIEDLQKRLEDFHERTSRIPTLTDLIIILALGFVGAWLCFVGGQWLAENVTYMTDDGPKPALSATTWKFILITTGGVILSFSKARNLEGAGASKLGSVMLYLLVASIGAHADFAAILKAPGLIMMGFIWMAFHVTILLVVGKLIKAPIFFVAVGSQANIGGAASAPIVASAFHPTLAPVGVLLAVAGYVLGTYAGLLCMFLLKMAA